MKIILIAAEAANKVIGNDGKMPWHIPEDLEHFKDATVGSAVIMGRKTFESIGSRPLPARRNIVVSKTMEPREGVFVVRSFRAAIKALIACDYEMCFVMGGAELYKSAMPWTTRIILTKLYKSYEGDTHFPDIDPTQWLLLTKSDYFDASQPFTVQTWTSLNPPDVAQWVDLIKD